MDRLLRLPLGLAAAALLCAFLSAQPAKWPLGHGHHAAQSGQPAPFPVNKEEPPSATAVEFRSPDQMSDADRTLEADSESAIASRAGLDALEFNQGDWTHQQIVCRALPNHLFLRFTRNDGARDRSVFTVSIPRNRTGHVRLIPVLRRGYSLFSPAGENAGTIAAFNQIRREDGAGSQAGWLETGLCYAALAGADPSVGPLTGDEVLNAPTPPVAEMEVQLDGGAIVRFTDQASQPHPTLWVMTFNPQGTLLKVEHQTAPPGARWVVPKEQKLQEQPVPAAADTPVRRVPSNDANPAPPAHLIPR